MKTFKVLKWTDAPPTEKRCMEYDLVCENCETEAVVPARLGTFIVARTGMGFVFEGNRHGKLPEEIQCRKCKKIFGLS